MAKKDKDKDAKKAKKAAEEREPEAQENTLDAIRAAVERTFQVTAGALGTRDRANDIVEEATTAARRLREGIDELFVLDDLRGLREEVRTLARRVDELEQRLAATADRPAGPVPVADVPSPQPAPPDLIVVEGGATEPSVAPELIVVEDVASAVDPPATVDGAATEGADAIPAAPPMAELPAPGDTSEPDPGATGEAVAGEPAPATPPPARNDPPPPGDAEPGAS